ncbi:MAG: hypothetical protein C4K60_08365 [Ideonella sp. MAG2]|nr:MAG: hypothetical protein C4K60_08365 [Ideonella sp. MAG2]
MIIRLLSLAAVTGLSCASALAGRPMATEDAGVLDAGACELESFAGRSRPAGGPSSQVLSMQLGCGVGANSQLALAAARSNSDGESTRTLTLLGKTALNPDADDDAPSYALAWALGADSAQGGMRHEGTALNAVMSWPLHDKVTLHANIGWSHSASAKQSTTGWAVGVEHNFVNALDMTAETYGNDRESAPWVQVGLRWAVRPNQLYVDTNYGVQVGGDRQRSISVGLRWAF